MSHLRIVSLAAAAFLSACTTAPAQPWQLAAPMRETPPKLRTMIPDDGTKRPAVLLVPGCAAPLISSRAALFTRYASRLNEAGFAAAVLNYPGAEQGEPACEQTAPPALVASAIREGLAELAAHPGVNPARLHVVGWSWGGRGVLDALNDARPIPGLVSAAALYPNCPPPGAWASPLPLLMLVGEKDTIAPADACRAWADGSEGPGPVVIHRYVAVGHGFDADEAGDPAFAAYATGAPLNFDASTGYQAWLDLLKFLKLDFAGAGA